MAHRANQEVTPAQVIRAANRVTGLKVGTRDTNVSSVLDYRARSSAVIYWELGRGASAKAPIGKNYQSPLRLLAHS